MTGRYKAYPDYKESGVSWLEKVPTHWDITKTAWHFVAEKGKNGQVLTNEYIGQNNGDYPVYSGQTGNNGVMGCINTYEFDTGKEGVLFSTTVGAKAMTLNHLKGKFSLSQNCLIIQKTSPIFNTRFCFYHFQPLFSFERGLIPEHMQASFRMEDLYQYKIALPSFEEQQKIANFLDHETAKIDTLITKQEKLIELLKEKRQAVISHAVTKGLNPDAPMKDSGVEWLGEVPEHWDVASIRRFLLEHRQGYYTTEPYIEDGVKLLRITDLRDLGEVNTDNCPKVPEHSSLLNYYLKEGDVVFARTGGAGSFGVIPKITETLAYASYLIRFRFIPEHFNTDYQRFMLIADSFQLAVKSNIHGGVNQNIHAEDIKDTFVCCPPLKEQQFISEFLNDVCVKYNLLIDKATQQIELMNERKIALISAAVTGKIDVRDFVLAKSEASQ